MVVLWVIQFNVIESVISESKGPLIVKIINIISGNWKFCRVHYNIENVPKDSKGRGYIK